MRRIFSDIMEPEDLTRFVIEAPARHFQFVHELTQSNRERLSEDDKLYLLRQYTLILERELKWSERAIRELEGGAKPLAGEAQA
jgi:hypothetical protein